MAYGYTIADTADVAVFREAAEFVKAVLHFTPITSAIEDVDGSIKQRFARGEEEITLESDAQVDYVGIKSNVELPIKCLQKWTTK